MKNPRLIGFGIILITAFSLPTLAQDKLLTIDDIFDPAKRVNFSGSVPTVKWLKDGVHYLQTNDPSTNLPRIQKVNTMTGEAVPFFDAAKMQAAFAALPGISAQDAKQLSNRGSYQLNPTETAVVINWANDLFYYEFGADRAIRLTSSPEEEIGEMFPFAPNHLLFHLKTVPRPPGGANP